ncbi:hypothetical protein GUJ93_ZPchr0007g5624 [Zizania palustris]|uniref:Reverse transcriptase domain-containing protein n=1 Tax=Zizania palustris TaxID=103762 RepID=A0A8J5TA13_ZIZPA|nr:hypothetical protein GUJ93_ZPchr0007g5624 [Zizania palustris]
MAWSLEYMYRCKVSKQQSLILKLDFEKTFDTVEHSVILLMLQHLGFPSKWVNWTRAVLSSAHSAVLLNGLPGKFFHCKRGVRQGDLLSPLLFVIVADLLQHITNQATRLGFIKAPICHPASNDFPIIQYADDTMVFLHADQKNIFFKSLINSFSMSTGLKVNYSKSSLIPINILEPNAQVLAGKFGCKLEFFPLHLSGLAFGSS